jgi:hypothetical protein
VVELEKISHFVRDDTSVFLLSFRADARNLSPRQNSKTLKLHHYLFLAKLQIKHRRPIYLESFDGTIELLFRLSMGIRMRSALGEDFAGFFLCLLCFIDPKSSKIFCTALGHVAADQPYDRGIFLADNGVMVVILVPLSRLARLSEEFG